jgi:hypothetical protein
MAAGRALRPRPRRAAPLCGAGRRGGRGGRAPRRASA